MSAWIVSSSQGVGLAPYSDFARSGVSGRHTDNLAHAAARCHGTDYRSSVKVGRLSQAGMQEPHRVRTDGALDNRRVVSREFVASRLTGLPLIASSRVNPQGTMIAQPAAGRKTVPSKVRLRFADGACDLMPVHALATPAGLQTMEVGQ